MPANNSIYNLLGRITASVITAVSVFIILTSFLSKEEADVSYEDLRKAYDGLSPRDYQ